MEHGPLLSRQNQAERILLAPAALEEASLERALARLARGRVDWADIYLQETISRDWLLEDSAVKTGSFSLDRGAGLRSVLGASASLCYANSLDERALLRLCDVHNIPVATNIATAEMLIHGLERGDLDWREIVKSSN